jgi:hypothetical protein
MKLNFVRHRSQRYSIGVGEKQINVTTIILRIVAILVKSFDERIFLNVLF